MKHTPLTVVYIITKLELGGAQKVCLSLCENLPDLGIETVLISGMNGPLVAQAQQLKNIILLPSLQRELSFKHIFQEITTFFTLIGELKKLKKKHPQIIVHTHSTKAGIIGRWAAFFAGIHTRIHTVHGFAFHPHQRWLAWTVIYLAEFFTYCITTHSICVSNHDARTGMRLFPFFKYKHSVIRAAVDAQKFYQPAHVIKKSFPQTSRPFIFGTISCFKKQKNIFDLLQAFTYVHAQNNATRLEIIGDGHLRPAIEQWIKEQNMHEAITLHGWQHDVTPMLHKWHAFVLSSLWEGLPCAIIEARLSRLPVVSYNTGGISEVIEHGNNGLLYPQKQWRALAHGMLMFSENQHQYYKCSSYQDNLEEFTIASMVNRHHDLYKKLWNQ